MQNGTTFINGNWAISSKLHVHLPFDTAIPILEMSPNGTIAKILKVGCRRRYSF